MNIKAIPLVVLSAIVSLGMEIPSRVKAESIVTRESANSSQRSKLAANINHKAPVKETNNNHIAEMFYPSASEPQALKVLGQGQVSMPADTANIEFSLSSQNTNEESSPPASEQSALPKVKKLEQSAFIQSFNKQKAEAITKETLKPVIDALSAIGIPANAIKFNIKSKSSSSFPFPFPSSSGGVKMLVKVDKPTQERMQQVVTVVNEAATKKSALSVDSVKVQYAMNDCQALVKMAYEAAVKNARLRAEAMASAMGVQLGKVPSVSDSFFYDLFVPLCSTESNISSFLPFGGISTSYDPDAPVEVQLRRDIFVTYPIK